MHDIKLIMTTTMTAPIIIGSGFELEEEDSLFLGGLFICIPMNA